MSSNNVRHLITIGHVLSVEILKCVIPYVTDEGVRLRGTFPEEFVKCT
jgi:hypothetical protein